MPGTFTFDKGGDQPPLLLGRTARLQLDRPRIMAVLNVTPDSFSDGGRYAGRDAALRRVEQMVAEGADLIDVGGESTRPGAAAVPEAQELERVVPVVEAIHARFDIPVSVDTNKSAVAAASMQVGAEFINDISGFSFDPHMATVAAETGAGVFLMHTRGRPEKMQRRTDYADIVAEVIAVLRDAVQLATAVGIPTTKVSVDPGIGFGKSAAGNLELLRRLGELRVLGLPILIGTSRKSFIGKVLGVDDPQQRLYGTLATVALGVAAGAQIFRVHDVRAARETAQMAWAVVQGGASVS